MARSKGHGDWRNWFLAEDVAYFKPLFSDFMQALGYEDCWDLPERPVVSAEKASGYLMRLAEERGRFRSIDYGLDSFAPENNDCIDPSLAFRPCLIPNLRPKATEVYPSRGAVIRDPHVETVDGQRVNVLSPGDRYVYKYEVQFTSPLRNVSCWMALVDQQGEMIASNGTLNGGGCYELVAAGSLLSVEFESICHLTSGVYFLNAGVLASEAGMPASYASRIVAATLIVVRPSSEIAPPRVTALPAIAGTRTIC